MTGLTRWTAVASLILNGFGQITKLLRSEYVLLLCKKNYVSMSFYVVASTNQGIGSVDSKTIQAETAKSGQDIICIGDSDDDDLDYTAMGDVKEEPGIEEHVGGPDCDTPLHEAMAAESEEQNILPVSKRLRSEDSYDLANVGNPSRPGTGLEAEQTILPGPPDDATRVHSEATHDLSNMDNSSSPGTGLGTDGTEHINSGAEREAVPASSSIAQPAVEVQELQPRTRTETGRTISRGDGSGGQKVYSSLQDVLLPLSPPGCVISLNYNDHRWVSTWKIKTTPEVWIDELSNKTYSRTFKYQDESDWLDKLRNVHSFAWEKWELARDELPELQLLPGRVSQSPGHIEQSVIDRLRSIVKDLPAPKDYSRSAPKHCRR